MNLPQHLSMTNEHFSPPWLVEIARCLMGGIDYDPASSRIANQQIVKAKFFSTEEDDSLRRPDWSILNSASKPRVYLNPPGGKIKNRSGQQIFFNRLYKEWVDGNIQEAFYVGFNLNILHLAPKILDFPVGILADRVRYYTHDFVNNTVREGNYSAKSLDYAKDCLDKGVAIDPAKMKWTNSPTHPTLVAYLPPDRSRANFPAYAKSLTYCMGDAASRVICNQMEF